TAATEARSPLEEGLARVWAEVLRLDHVGIHDNFLELGGDSIEATLIASRAHDELSLDIPLDVLLGEATIAEQARAIESHDQTAL
ncbi:phosphopantetheine-binding protein, partial [Klebsiella pneumoniae]|uniref:phosphopantetheine-binding protein n=1 Tax=Klebsiella pneumoniae TaxID=573 RepID=UPI003F51CA02